VDSWALWLPNSGMWSHQSKQTRQINHPPSTFTKSCSISSVQGVRHPLWGGGGAPPPPPPPPPPPQSKVTGGMPTGTAMG